MSIRKQPSAFYQQKLKAVLVLIGLVVLYTLLFSEGPWNRKTKSRIVDIHDQALSQRLDSLLQTQAKISYPLAPFHPNFLSDYRAYRLGLPPETVDRVQAYHQKGMWMSSRSVFQKVSGVPDSTYERITPYLKFPPKRLSHNKKVPPPAKFNLNRASAEDLQKVRGIGPVYSQRILAYRDRIQAFVSWDQLEEVNGLSVSTRDALKGHFEISLPFEIVRIPFAETTLDALANLPYISYEEARWLVAQRTKSPELTLEELLENSPWDAPKVQRIKLYLY